MSKERSEGKHKAGGNSGKAAARVQNKRLLAEERADARVKRTAEEQLALLDKRPGDSRKEREKLS